MSKAADLANLIGNINAGGGGVNRNLIINGAMNVNQRGTITGISTSQNTIDRYRLNTTSLDQFACTVSQDSDTPSGFSNSMKVDTTTAESAIATDERCSIEQRIEAQNLQHLLYGSSDAKTLTLSFFVKSSVAGKYGINIRHHDASVNKGLDYTIDSADTWERKEISFTGYTSTAIADDNGIGLWIRWMLIVGTDFQNTAVEDAWDGNTSYYTTTGMQSTWGTSTDHNFYLTGVQLEIGQNATEFEHEPFETTLRKCLRYYYDTQSDGGTSDYRYAISDGANGVYINAYIELPVPMRATPSGTTTVAGAFYYNSGSGDSNVTPSGGQNASAGRTHELVRIGWYNHSNNIGGTHDQKVGQWACAANFDAEL